ncbi:unnamed protein product, partial [Laminaria digitata]
MKALAPVSVPPVPLGGWIATSCFFSSRPPSCAAISSTFTRGTPDTCRHGLAAVLEAEPSRSSQCCSSTFCFLDYLWFVWFAAMLLLRLLCHTLSAAAMLLLRLLCWQQQQQAVQISQPAERTAVSTCLLSMVAYITS